MLSENERERTGQKMTFGQMVDAGVYDFAGFEDNGEIKWALNPEVAKVKAPEVFWKYQNDMETALFDLVAKGIVEYEIDPVTLEEHLIFPEMY